MYLWYLFVEKKSSTLCNLKESKDFKTFFKHVHMIFSSFSRLIQKQKFW